MSKENIQEEKINAKVANDKNKAMIVDGMVLKKARDELFIDTKIVATIHGVSYSSKYDEEDEEFVEDRSSFQLQHITMNSKGEMEKKTLKVNKSIEENKLEQMIGKTFLFTEIQEFKHQQGMKYTFTYSASKIEEFKSDKDIFEIQKKCHLKISNIIEETKEENRRNAKTGKSKIKTIKTGNVLIQGLVKENLRVDLKTIRVKGIDINSLKSLQGKEVVVSSLTTPYERGKRMLITDTLPEIKS